jgi:zinc protease
MWRIWTILSIASLLAWAPRLHAAQEQDVLRATLDNGLRVVIVRNTLAPVVTTVVNYRVGSDEASEGFPGMAHAQEHMMFRGSPGLSADQLAEISAAMGGSFDADTQQVVTQYFFTVPAQDLEVALHIEAVRMNDVLDSDQLWDQERGAIEQEVAQDLSNPQYVFYTKLLETMFRGTPYSHDALGTRPSFDKTTGDALKKFHDTWYAPNNAILVIVGDVQPQAVLTEVKALFGGFAPRNIPSRPEIDLKPVEASRIDLTTDLPYGMAVVSFRMPGSDSPDFAATQVLADVLSSHRGNLYALVPQGKALYTDFSLDSLPKASLGYATAAFPKGGDANTLVEEVRNVLSREAAGPLSKDLIEAAKRHEVAGAEFEKNSVSGLAMLWSQALAVEGRQSPEDDINAIKRVSAADVARVAKQYLSMNHAVVAVLTPQPSGHPVSASSFGGRESLTAKQVKPVALPEWADAPLRHLSVPKSTVHPVTFTLPNGLRLIVQPESVSPTVSIYGHIRNNPDLQTPKGQEGVDDVLDELLSYGTTTLDRLAFEKALDDIAASESAGTDFSLQVLASQFERGVALLADNELHPALPETAFHTIRPQLAREVAGQLQSPSYLSDRAIHAALFPKNDPTLRQAEPATISSLSLQQVHGYYRYVFRPDLTTIVVIGEITPDQARTVIEKYFGSWKAAGAKPNTVLPPVPNNEPSATSVPDASRVQDKVTLAETLGLNRSNDDYYALQLGNHVLSGGFYATRLYRDLRERTGLVYYVSSSLDVGKTRGIYEVDYACDPPNVSKARAIVEQDLRDMQNTLVGTDELRRAKALLVRQIPLAESSVGRIASGLLSRVSLDLPLDEPTRSARLYLKLTPEQVKTAFAKWLRPGDLVQVVQGPSPQ